MYISFENYQFEVRLNNKNSTVYIENKHDETYIIRVPLDFKDDELIQYLKTNVKKLIQDFEKQQQVYIQPKTIKIYNKEFLYVHNPNAVGSFKKNNSIIISSHSLRSHKQIIKDILLFDINGLISFWEENLHFLIENIYLKNYKTKSFKICNYSKAIDFSISLKDYSYSYLEYTVAKAIFEYLKLDEIQQIELFEKFVNDWRQNKRISDYERDVRIQTKLRKN